MSPKPLLDVGDAEWAIVQNILRLQVPEREVWAFGSRAKWTAKEFSDLDLAIIGQQPLTMEQSTALADAFAESDLPWKVDVVDWATTSESFRKIIERDKVVVQPTGKKGKSGGWGMGSEWPTVRLGAHVDACLGKMLDAKKNKGAPQPYLGNSNVRWGQFDLADLAEMKFEPHEEERYSLLPGDLVVCEGGEPGRCAIWTGPRGMKIQKALHRIRPKKSLDNYYLFYWFQLAAKQGLLEPNFTGTTIKHLTGKAIAALDVPLPPVEVQRAMVEVLKQLDDRITLLRETNATLEIIAQALFKSWFVDFDPVRAKMEGRVPEGMDEATAALFPDSFEETELGTVPRGWRVGTLADLTNLNPESWTAKNHPDTVAYIDLANAKDNEIVSITDFAFDDAPSRARRVLRDGDTIVGTVRPGNRSFAFIRHPANNLTASTGFAVLRPLATENMEFVFLAATQDASIEHFAHVADGGAYPAVRPEVVSSLLCVVPDRLTLKAFHLVAETLLSKVTKNQQKAQTLSALRDNLLPRLISGQLRLPELEAVHS